MKINLYFILSLLVPNVLLVATEGYGFWAAAAGLLLPAGVYLLWSAAFKRAGLAVWIAFPLVVLCAFQLVLLYLFGNSIAGADMFTNLLTTNSSEAGELLGNLWPSIVGVVVLYLPLLVWAMVALVRRRRVAYRGQTALLGVIALALGTAALFPAWQADSARRLLRTEVFPMNVAYNMKTCLVERNKTMRFAQTSAGFSYHAMKTASAGRREVYVYVIGEASRAENWQLYGYDRPTTPLLMGIQNLVAFNNTLTQSNTTHKSVPLLLSSVDTAEHEELYRRRGLPALFNEAGFRTAFFTNQRPQGMMIDRLAADADTVRFLDEPRYDMQLLDALKAEVARDSTSNLLVILHCYGSHFRYRARYPRSEAFFQPDDEVSISADHREKLVNAYDNSIRYTDKFLASTIAYLGSLDACTALLYCADHGEDLFDDARGNFLHASPRTTYHQLHVANLAWFSPSYLQAFPAKVTAARANTHAPATTRSMFQTMADIASIKGDHVSASLSLVSPAFDYTRPRRYLNDHNQALPFQKTGLEAIDLQTFAEHGIEL